MTRRGTGWARRTRSGRARRSASGSTASASPCSSMTTGSARSVDGCNRKGRPALRRSECATSSWSAPGTPGNTDVITGKGPEGYEEEQESRFSTSRSATASVFVATPRSSPRVLVEHEPSPLLAEHPRPDGAPPACSGSRPRRWTDSNPRFSGSDALLDHALEYARESLGAETRSIRLREPRSSGNARATTRRRPRLHLAVRRRRTGPDGSLTPGVRRPRPLGRCRARLHADPLGRGVLALLPMAERSTASRTRSRRTTAS